MSFISSVKDEPELSKYYLGFKKGLNTVQDQSLIDDTNLSVATNVELVVDGIERRHGSTKVFDEASATKVYGSIGFYKKSASTRQFLRMAHGYLQYLDTTTDTWTEVTSHAFSNIPTTFVQARDNIYIYNGTENLRKWDGSTISTYTAITTPTDLAVVATYKNTLSVSSITRVTTTATATIASAHGLATGDYVTMAGAAQAEYNGKVQVTVVSDVVFTYTVSGTPATPATGTITIVGAGTKAYSYQVSAFNSTGETIACTAVAIADGPAILSVSKYNKLDWTAVANASGYNIYGNTTDGLGEAFMTAIYTNTYNDTGFDVPVNSKLPPTTNNTGGIKGKYGIFTGGRQYVAGVTEGSTYHPCRMFYSGVIEYVDSFVGSDYGGGWVDISANDGGEIVDIKPYKNGVLIWKTNGLFKFYFTTSGLPATEEITKAHGGVSFNGSQEKDTDYIYVAQKENRIMVMTVGYQENYASDELRTNEVTVFIQDDLVDVNHAYLSNVATFSYDNKFGFTYTSGTNTLNSKGYVIDTRFGGWVKWTGLPMECTHYTVYDDGSNVHLYGGSNADGYMIELFKDSRNDNGSTFQSVVTTKAYNLDFFDVEKIFRDPSLWFKYISGGSISLEMWADGTRKVGTGTIGISSYGAAVGGDLAGSFLAGHTLAGSSTTISTADVPKVLEFLEMCRSLKISLIDENLNSNWKFMGVHLKATPLQDKPLGDEYRITIT